MILTFRDKLYQFVLDSINESNYSPSFAEMIAAVGISPRSKSLITRSLRMLAEEGKLQLVKEGRRLLISLPTKKLPLHGIIGKDAAMHVLSNQQLIDVGHLFTQVDCVALQIQGTSMLDEGMLDGDVIIYRKRAAAKENDMVVALIDQRYVAVKRISYAISNMITLISANPLLKPRAYAKHRISIHGIYIGLVRVAFDTF